MSKIRNHKKISTPLDFSNLTMKGGKIYPTDIDALIELDDTFLILIEAKELGCRIPTGQRLAFERIIKAWDESSETREGVLLKVEHVPLKDNELAIDLGIATVTRVYYKGKWLRKNFYLPEYLDKLGKEWKCDKLEIAK